ncbi:relaxase/mobilization nuclease domain-containing protein [Allohahella marinimesophila]|uniref:MobA/VirD2-like nuclease domain-containing protein n=1 Tax=Allohahella marinimesophila TaxID=1054972 RepID=A0ABP7NUQ0_9GAMM
MIHKKKEFSPDALGRLKYIYGAKHEHKVEHVRPIQGSCFAEPVIEYDEKGKIASIDFDDVNDELEMQGLLHQGKGEKLYSHYIISLAPGEKLTDEQWSDVLQDYMGAMGYDAALTKYTAVVHGDTDLEHMHIVACRVVSELGGPLVDDTNDYDLGLSSMRRLELKYGLRVVPNPEDNFGKDYSKDEMKGYGSRDNAKNADEGSIIRARINDLWAKNKPVTFEDLALSLKEKGVDIKCRPGSPTPSGICYKLTASDNWISGTRIKKTRLTFEKLMSKEGIDYAPARDDKYLALSGVLLGLKDMLALSPKEPAALTPKKSPDLASTVAPKKRAPRKLAPVEIICGYRVYIPLNNLHLSAAERNGLEMPLYKSTTNKRATYTSWDFILNMAANFSKTKRERALEAQMAELLRFVEEMMKLLFGTLPSESVFITHGAEAEQIYGINKVKEREVKDVQDKKAKEIADEIKKEEQWIDGARLQEIPGTRYDWDADCSMALVPREFQQTWR